MLYLIQLELSRLAVQIVDTEPASRFHDCYEDCKRQRFQRQVQYKQLDAVKVTHKSDQFQISPAASPETNITQNEELGFS